MGRTPDTDTANDTDTITAEGHLSPEVWARLVLARVNKADTGTLTVTRDSNTRTFRFLNGTPIAATSTIAEEDFTETMVATGVFSHDKLVWIRKHTSVDESEIEALIGAGTIDRSAVDAHHATHIEHLVAATVAWPAGEFSWSGAPAMGDKIERSLLPSVNAIEGMIRGILGGFDLGALHTYVDAADAGDFLPDARLTGERSPAWVPRDLNAIHTQLGQGLTRDEISENLTVDSDRVAAMLWLLEATGWARRAHPPAALIPLGTVATIQQGQTETRQEAAPKPARPQAKTVSSPSAKPKPSAKPTAPKPTQKKQNHAEFVKKTAPAPRTPTIDPEAGLKRALKSIADSDFDAAYRLLGDVRKERPSCPDTLAALGWTAWRTENLGTNAYDGPEDFLLLALTFDAAHPKALEYYARIAIEKGEKENARNRLLQVLKATPESPWARNALDELNPKGKGKSGMRLWPKGSS